MSAEHPVTELMSEHRLIEKVMSALEQRLQTSGNDFPSDFVAQALAFFVEFADGNHHFKEEEVLFPALARRGVPVEGGPIGMMLQEHTLGRKLLAGIRENLPAARDGNEIARESVRSFAAQYVDLLRRHIWKEDNILFRMAQQSLDPNTVEDILLGFHESAHSKVTPELTSRHAAFAAAL